MEETSNNQMQKEGAGDNFEHAPRSIQIQEKHEVSSKEQELISQRKERGYTESNPKRPKGDTKILCYYQDKKTVQH